MDAFLAELNEEVMAAEEVDAQAGGGAKNELKAPAEAEAEAKKETALQQGEKRKLVVLEEIVAAAPKPVSVVAAAAVPAPVPVAVAAGTAPPAGRNNAAVATAPAPPPKSQTAAPQTWALPSAPAPPVDNQAKAVKRSAGGKEWEDAVLATWPTNDFRLFIGNISPEITDEDLLAFFKKDYPSIQRTRIIRDHLTGASKSYGFASFAEPMEMVRAMREKDGKFLGNRQLQIKKAKKDEAQKPGSVPAGGAAAKRAKR